MKKEIKKLIKRILLWIFKDRVEVFRIQQVISDEEMMRSRGDIRGYIKKDMAIRIGIKLLDSGFLEIESIENPQIKATELKAKLYCIKT